MPGLYTGQNWHSISSDSKSRRCESMIDVCALELVPHRSRIILRLQHTRQTGHHPSIFPSRMPTILYSRVYANSNCCKWDAKTSMGQATLAHPAWWCTRYMLADPVIHTPRLSACCVAISYRTLLRMCKKDQRISTAFSRMSDEQHSRRPWGTWTRDRPPYWGRGHACSVFRQPYNENELENVPKALG